ncbi:MAG: 50S ribosomal protein L13 [Candidatus Helarchaeota archaeon]|nr:50S ribosomal protein L13 [Candidatus Helarchaeota archaeon]
MKPRIINADGLILGRLASSVAKMLLLGERVIIVNAEKSVISGKRRTTLNHYKERQNIRTHTNPTKGPFWFKTPNQLVRRTIRGMLPWKKDRGRRAYRNLKVYIGIPEELNINTADIETFSDHSIDQLKGSFIQVKELAKEIGFKHE